MSLFGGTKKLRVIYGPQHNPQSVMVKLNGIAPDEPLTPKMARRASRVAHGSGYAATVWDGNIGYRLYKNSARKVYS